LGHFQLEFIAVSCHVFRDCSESACFSQNVLNVLFANVLFILYINILAKVIKVPKYRTYFYFFMVYNVLAKLRPDSCRDAV